MNIIITERPLIVPLLNTQLYFEMKFLASIPRCVGIGFIESLTSPSNASIPLSFIHFIPNPTPQIHKYKYNHKIRLVKIKLKKKI